MASKRIIKELLGASDRPARAPVAASREEHASTKRENRVEFHARRVAPRDGDARAWWRAMTRATG